jgi:hypothetical protein
MDAREPPGKQAFGRPESEIHLLAQPRTPISIACGPAARAKAAGTLTLAGALTCVPPGILGMTTWITRQERSTCVLKRVSLEIYVLFVFFVVTPRLMRPADRAAFRSLMFDKLANGYFSPDPVERVEKWPQSGLILSETFLFSVT